MKKQGSTNSYSAMKKAMDGDWGMAFATPDRGTFKAHLDIDCRLETYLLDMYPRISGVDMSLQTPYEELISKRPGEA